MGGHGTANAAGAALVEAGWPDGLAVANTMATAGLISGIVVGMIIIGIGVRRGYAQKVSKPQDVPVDIKEEDCAGGEAETYWKRGHLEPRPRSVGSSTGFCRNHPGYGQYPFPKPFLGPSSAEANPFVCLCHDLWSFAFTDPKTVGLGGLYRPSYNQPDCWGGT